MSEQFIIEGSTVKRVRVQELASFGLQDFMQRMQSNVQTPILPRNCVLYRQRNNLITVVTQLEPRKQKIVHKRLSEDFDPDEDDREDHIETVEYNLQLPWVVMVHYLAIDPNGNRTRYRYDKMRIAFRSRAMMEHDMDLKIAPLLNVFSDSGIVCLGSHLESRQTDSVSEMIAQVETIFWNSEFNDDIRPNDAAMELLGGDMDEWQELTASQVLDAVNSKDWPQINEAW